MIRLAPTAHEIAKKFHIDMDDLLSDRYFNFYKNGINGFGFLSDVVSNSIVKKPIMYILERAKRIIFKTESKHIARREHYWATHAHTVSLVSEREAKKLQLLTNAHVYAIPMSLPTPEKTWTARSIVKSAKGIFVGSTEVPGNLISLISLEETLQSTAPSSRLDHIQIIGKATEQSKRHFSSKKIKFTGYIDDLSEAFLSSDFYCGHISGGTGINTKIVEAMSYGIPIYCTKDAIKGIEGAPGIYVGKDNDLETFIATIENYSSHEKCLARRIYFEEHFSKSSINEKWQKVFNSHDYICKQEHPSS
jgi:hypothetical protein